MKDGGVEGLDSKGKSRERNYRRGFRRKKKKRREENKLCIPGSLKLYKYT